MSSTKFENDRAAASPGDALELNVFLVHEDVASALRAKHALDRIARQPGLQTSFRVKLWNFTLLGNRKLQAGLAEEARRSDIVLLSAGACRQLPLRIYAWIEDCLRSRMGDPFALIVSLDSATRDLLRENPLVRRIRAIAKRTGADFFAHYAASSSEEQNGSPPPGGVDPSTTWLGEGTTAGW